MRQILLWVLASFSSSIAFADTVVECKSIHFGTRLITVKEYSIAKYDDQALSSLALVSRQVYVDERTRGLVSVFNGWDKNSKVRFELNQKTFNASLHTDVGTDYEDTTAYKCSEVEEQGQEAFWNAIRNAIQAGDRGAESTRVIWGARG